MDWSTLSGEWVATASSWDSTLSPKGSGCGVAKEHGAGWNLTCTRSATASSLDLVRDTRHTLKPIRASWMQNSLPMPSDAPVTTAHGYRCRGKLCELVECAISAKRCWGGAELGEG